MKKRLFGIAITLWMVFLFAPTAVFAAEDVTYYDWNDRTNELESKICSNATEVTANDTSWGADNQTTWYVASGDITIGTADSPRRVIVSGDVHLILADGCSLTVNGGIRVEDDGDISNGSENSLTIYRQASGTGKLTVQNVSSNYAAIGSSGNGGIVTINGGSVTATGTNGAGIDGAVTINSGTVTATSTNGAGISGAFETNNGNAVIFASSIADQSNKSIWSGVIFEGDNGSIYGTSVTPSEDFTIEIGKFLVIASGKTLTIPDGVTLTNNGTIYVDGTFNGTADNLYYTLETVDADAYGNIAYHNSKKYGKVGSEITLTPYTIIGMQFDYWEISSDVITIINNKFIMPSASITVRARFTNNQLQITFDSNGGDTPAKRYYYASSDFYGYPVVNPTRAGYSFDGWWTKNGSNGDWGVEYTYSDFDYEIYSGGVNKTVYAKWVQPIRPTADMFDFTLNNVDQTAVTNRVTVTPKEEYRDIFSVKKVKYYLEWIDSYYDEFDRTWGSFIVIAEIESSSAAYASTDNLKIRRIKNHNGFLYIDEQSTGDLLLKYNKWNYEGGELAFYEPGFTTNSLSMTDQDGYSYDVLKLNINRQTDGSYKIKWDYDAFPANEYKITYLSNFEPHDKDFRVMKCPVFPLVENTEQQYSQSGNQINIVSNGTRYLDNSKLKVEYYPVDEANGRLASLTPQSQVTEPGKYLYVISIDDSDPDISKNYEILFRYVVKGDDIPYFEAFDNVGYFTVTKTDADITPQTNAEHTYNGLTYDVSGLFDVGTLAGYRVYSIVNDSETTGEGTLGGNILTITKAGTFKIKLNTAATSYCNAGEATATLTVRKGTPRAVVYPTAGTINYGETLANSVLTGGSTNGSFDWRNGSTRPTVNNSGYEVMFTPNDGDLYDYSGVILTQSVSVSVNPRKVNIEWLGTDGLVYDESIKTVSARVTNAVFDDTPTLTLGGVYSATQVGSYTATVTGVDNQNYTLDGVETTKTWNISAGLNSFTSALTITGWTYGDMPNSPSVSSKFGTPRYLYSESASGAFTSDVPQNAGTYYVKAVVDGTVDYAQLISDTAVDFEIAPKSIADAVLTATNSLTYNGQPQRQEIGLDLNGFTNVTYDISGDVETDVNQNGSYTLTVTGTGNFTGTKELYWNIARADLTENPYNPTTARVSKNSPLAAAEVREGEMLGVGNAVIDGIFAWDDPSEVITADTTAAMVFTPADGNYNEKVIDVSVTVYSSGGDIVLIMFYTVKFDPNGGSEIKNQTVMMNGRAKEPPTPTKDGYIFEGWYTDSEFTKKYDFNTRLAKGITLFAKWTKEEIEQPIADEWENPFTDVKENDWFFESVKFVYRNGLMNGTSSTEFSPASPLTRGMLVSVLYRAECEPEVNKIILFSDVKSDMYYADAVVWAQQNSIVNGVSETEFAPDDNITREQIAAIMYRYAKFKGYDVSVGEDADILACTDFGEISEYAVEAMKYAVGRGLMEGKTETTLAPKDFATRAEIAAILHRFIEGSK